MKRLFKRNQIIITALAIMIAIAGYLNFADDKVQKVDTKVKNKETSEADLLEETVKVDDEVAQDDLLNSSDDIESMDTDVIDENAQAQGEGESSVPGEAVLVNTSGNLTFVNEAKLNREQVRAKNKDLLNEIINNQNISDGEKQNAISNLIAITEIAEKEAAAEMLLVAKGFEDSVVSITDGVADVLINLTSITDVQRAQIEDVVKNKTGLNASKISIVPITTSN